MGGGGVGAQSRSQGLEGVCWLSGLEDFREKERHRKKRRETEMGRWTKSWHGKSGEKKRERIERDSHGGKEQALVSKSQLMKKQEEPRG